MEQYKKIISQIAGNLQAFNTAVANATGKLNNVQPAQSNADREQTGMGKPFINCHIHKAPSYKAA